MPTRMIEKTKRFINRCIAAEISSMTRYMDLLVHFRPLEHDQGAIFNAIDCLEKTVAMDFDQLPSPGLTPPQNRTGILLNGTFNHNLDIEGLLIRLKTMATRSTRIIAVVYNPYFRWLYRFANWVGIRQGDPPPCFLTLRNLDSITKLAGFEVVRLRNAVYCPVRVLGLGCLINKLLPTIPLLRWFSLVSVITLKPIIPDPVQPSLSIVIPARNEHGNIENALKRIPNLGEPQVEIIFVEGHSTDNTWEEIQRVIPLYAHRFKIMAFQQTGKGKNDAVRLGFSKATGELLTILDADLTMPPELIGRFYEAYCTGLSDFINGNRLVYPMEGLAMRFLNRMGNVFFAKALSYVLDTQIGDSLCGTKLLSRHDYHRILRWRDDFGDFDPFGDYELLFPAAILGLGVVDIPIRYLSRQYGDTNIHRFRHGMMLIKMVVIGYFRVKLGKTPWNS